MNDSHALQRRLNFWTNFNRVVLVNLFAATANMLSGIWFARFLGPQPMGDYAILIVTLQLLTALMVPGFNQAVIREPSNKEIAAAASFATGLQSILMALVCALLYALAYWYDSSVADGLWLPGAFLLASTILSLWTYLLASPFEAEMNYQFLLRIRLMGIAGGIVAGVWVVLSGGGLYGLIVRDMITSCISFSGTLMKSPQPLTWRNWRKGMSDLLYFTKGMWGLNAMEKLALRFDYAVIGTVFEKDVLGVYFAIRGLVEGGLGMIITPIQTVLYSFYCRDQGSVLFSRKVLKKVVILTGCLALFALTVAQMVGPVTISLLFGPSYQNGDALLGGFALYAIAVAWFENLKVLAMSRNRHHAMLVVRVVQIAMLACLTYPLVRLAGLTGAGISAALAATVMAGLAAWLVVRWPREEREGFPVHSAMSKCSR